VLLVVVYRYCRCRYCLRLQRFYDTFPRHLSKRSCVVIPVVPPSYWRQKNVKLQNTDGKTDGQANTQRNIIQLLTRVTMVIYERPVRDEY
jgi:hypothetical protein